MKYLFIIVPFLFVYGIIICSAPAKAEEQPSFKIGRDLYMHYCAPCHGKEGNGKGFNAQYLDPRPVDHTDTEFMSKRKDKELFNAISGGGKMIGKSTLMPPWGNTLNDVEIKSLITYLRRLCGCGRT